MKLPDSYYIQPDPFEPPDDVLQAVESLLDVGHESWQTPDLENFDHCLLCDEVDGHANSCPIPALQAWMTQTTEAH